MARRHAGIQNLDQRLAAALAAAGFRHLQPLRRRGVFGSEPCRGAGGAGGSGRLRALRSSPALGCRVSCVAGALSGVTTGWAGSGSRYQPSDAAGDTEQDQRQQDQPRARARRWGRDRRDRLDGFRARVRVSAGGAGGTSATGGTGRALAVPARAAQAQPAWAGPAARRAAGRWQDRRARVRCPATIPGPWRPMPAPRSRPGC